MHRFPAPVRTAAWLTVVLAFGLLAGCATEGDKYLDEIRPRPGVVSLRSGLLYEILRPGNGSAPKASDTVRVNYVGRLPDGRIFDASSLHSPPGPTEFRLTDVIPGWTEGLQHITPGGIIRLYIPSSLAYGSVGVPPVIPPDATLVFDVELLEVVPAKR